MARIKKADSLADESPEESQFPIKAPSAACSLCSLREMPFVPPYGNRDNPLLAIVGEAPGKDEVLKGRPFIGKAGIFLSKVLSSLKISEGDIYLTNACMCRPIEEEESVQGKKEKNVKPDKAAINACRDRLISELAYVNPTVIIAAGESPYHALFREKRAITKARGKPAYLEIEGAQKLVMPTVHPSGVLHNPSLFQDFIDDVNRAREIAEGDAPWIDPPVENYISITADKPKLFESLLNRLESVEAMSVDIETSSLRFNEGEIVTCALSWTREKAISFEWKILTQNPKLMKRFGDHLKRIKCSFHNGMFDTSYLHQYGLDPNFNFDTMLADYILDERQGIHDLERLSINHYKAPTYKKDISKHIMTTPLPVVLEYNSTDADYTYRLTEDLRNEMQGDGKIHDQILIPAAKHFTWFNECGMRVDMNHLKMLGDKWDKEMGQLKSEMKQYSGAEFNPNSPVQVKKLLFHELKLKQMGKGDINKVITLDQMTLFNEIQDIEDTEAQEYWRSQSSKQTEGMKSDSTSMYMLYWLAQQHDFPRLLIKYRLAAKKSGTYYHGIEDALWADGRLRPQYKLHGTVTGRLSSEKPNIHGTPRSDKVDKIKDNYIADDGFILLYGDYSQAEVRMMAHFAKDYHLIEILSSDDIHYSIMKKLFGLSDEDVAKLPPEKLEYYRRSAKTITFGIMYGRSPKGLAPQMGITVEDASLYLDQYFEMMPGVRRWIARQKERVIIDHEVLSLYGRRRRFPFIADNRHKAEVQRQAVNMPIQSSVSDMTLLANLRTINEIKASNIACKPYPHIHDAFIIQVEKSSVAKAAKIMKDVMADVGFKTDVPFFADIKAGNAWGSVKKLPDMG